MLTLQVTGMSCNHCVEAVKQAVGGVDPAAQVTIDLESGRVEIAGDGDGNAFVQAIEDAGYDVAT